MSFRVKGEVDDKVRKAVDKLPKAVDIIQKWSINWPKWLI